MSHSKDAKLDLSDLRQRAEQKVEQENLEPEKLSKSETDRLIHELRVHQIELEMQNEELIETQVKLEESHNRYADLYDFAPVGYLMLDAWGRIIEANLTAATLLGVERSRLLDKYFWLFVVEEERPAFQRLLENISKLPQRQGEFHLREGTDEVRPVLLNFSFWQDENGNEIRRLSLTDLTERERVEQALRKSEERFRALVTATMDVVYRMSPDWTEMRQLKGRSFLAETTRPNQTWLEQYIFPEDQPHVLAVINEAIRTKSVFELEHRVRRVDGSAGWTLSRAVPILDVDGEIIEWFGAAKDITKRKEAEAALRASEQKLRHLTSQILESQEQERRRIARDLHDELGQALMALKMQFNAVKRSFQRGQEPWEEFDSALGFINSIAEEVRKICQSLRPGLLDDLGLNGALQHLLGEFQKHHGLEVIDELADMRDQLSPEVQITAYRVFQECLNNATRHGQATRVTVRSDTGNSAARFVFEDNGSGFDLEEVRSRDQARRGLGLTAMEERVRLLKGSFTITSAPGQGTHITFSLPLDKASQ